MNKFYNALHIIITYIKEQITQDCENKNDLLSTIQHIYGITQVPYSDDMKQSYLDFIWFLADIEDQTLDDELNRYINALQYYFWYIAPNSDVRYLLVAWEITFVHKDNFAITDIDHETNNNETNEIKEFLSINYKNHSTHYKDRINNMIAFNNKWERLEQFDFYLNTDPLDIQWPYFLLTEHKWLHDLRWQWSDKISKIVISKSNNPYSNKLTLDPVYVKYHAKFKILNGKLIQNHYLDSDHHDFYNH